MAKEILMQARFREESGKNAMRRLRRTGDVPGVIFGRSGETTPITFSARDLETIIHSDTGFNTIFTLDVDGLKKDNKRKVLIKDYQLDPVTHNFLHVSFYRIHMDRVLEVRIAVIPEGEAPGVKEQGGTMDHIMRDIHVKCLPSDIPDAVHVDVSKLRIGDIIRISDLEVPDTVEILEDPDGVVVHVVPPRKVVVEVEEEVEVAAEEEAAAEAEEAAEEKE